MPRPIISVVIHRATHADQQAVVDLLAAQLHEHGIQTSMAALTSAVAGILQHPERGTLLVATLLGRPVGVTYLAFTWALEHGGKARWLEELYVVPEYPG